LTERLYQTGSGTVKKTDFLRAKVIVSILQAMLAELSSNEALARAALINTIGLHWDIDLVPAEKEISFEPLKGDLKKLITNAYQFNPDWEKLQLALEAAEAGIKKARSGYFPVIALLGSLNHIDNSYDKGRVTDENVDSWSLGLSLNLPIFSGFQTVHAVREAKMRLEKLKHERVLFREGLALMIKGSLLQMERAKGQVQSTREALITALENRKLNVRAYQNELVETKEVIEAQLMESFIKGRYFKALHDHAISRAKIDFLIGNQIRKVFN
jgi:outer membrane protein TolC